MSGTGTGARRSAVWAAVSSQISANHSCPESSAGSGGHDVRDNGAPEPAGVPPQDLLKEFLRVLADAGEALVYRESMLAV
jgi:hypothetical protein